MFALCVRVIFYDLALIHGNGLVFQSIPSVAQVIITKLTSVKYALFINNSFKKCKLVVTSVQKVRVSGSRCIRMRDLHVITSPVQHSLPIHYKINSVKYILCSKNIRAVFF